MFRNYIFRFWDGSGGNNHAVDYFNETKYPLCVKLGTITPDGAGNLDLFYPESILICITLV